MLPSLVPKQQQTLFQQIIPRNPVSNIDITIEWLMKNTLELWKNFLFGNNQFLINETIVPLYIFMLLYQFINFFPS